MSPAVIDFFDFPYNNVYCAWLNLESVKIPETITPYNKYSAYPPVLRDLAFVVPAGTRLRDMCAAMRGISPAVSSVEIQDVYSGEKIGADRLSVMFSIEYSSMEKTFTSEEIAQLEKKMIALAADKFESYLRQ